jgi:hypothetical protein
MEMYVKKSSILLKMINVFYAHATPSEAGTEQRMDRTAEGQDVELPFD